MRLKGGVPDAPSPCTRTEKRVVTFNYTWVKRLIWMYQMSIIWF